ncbi:MAG: thrombospondin type 3 repeat-containing protein [Chitinophagaceae bacterium]|nr:thrombospondin type 3 repeat-containing protein [Chitinophagaceae bacterium]
MLYRKILAISIGLLFSTAITPLFAQDSPSKFEMKKDGDGDGVKNKRDKCPSTPPGVQVDGTGCPVDTDKDGVPDYMDKCPSIAGSSAMNGCQDKDKDGVSDPNDTCPDVPGDARFKGCPDSDGDGVQDSQDKCPNAAGLDRFQGCPDTDGDGVADANDKCPDTKKGVKTDANGCDADSDKDGVLDANDKCPATTAGTKVDAYGCPADTDGDGVADANDKCPGVVGVASNNGCPVAIKETPKRLQFATRRVMFESGNALIKTTSYPMLDEVANILKEYPYYNLRIGGHTDGLEKNPTTVSQSRADAVMAYLTGKGIADSRISISSYGKTRPAGSNANSTARTANRRVELDLYLR